MSFNTLRSVILPYVTVLTGPSSLSTTNNAQGSVVDFTQQNANIAGSRRGKWAVLGSAFGTTPVSGTGIAIYLAGTIDGATGVSGTVQTLPLTTTAVLQLPLSANIGFDGSAAFASGAWSLTSAEVDAPSVPSVVVLQNNSGQPLLNVVVRWIPITSQTNGTN